MITFYGGILYIPQDPTYGIAFFALTLAFLAPALALKDVGDILDMLTRRLNRIELTIRARLNIKPRVKGTESGLAGFQQASSVIHVTKDADGTVKFLRCERCQNTWSEADSSDQGEKFGVERNLITCRYCGAMMPFAS